MLYIKRRILGSVVLLLTCSSIYAQTRLSSFEDKEEPYRKGKLIYKEDFDHDLTNWVPETPPSPTSKIAIEKGKLVIDVSKGATVWLNKKLSGNIMITYQQEVVVKDGVNDRLSDLNQFWMATDPRNRNLFTRNGVFGRYDSLKLYYVGYGGNTNTTTRFRKYLGNGTRKLLNEYTDEAHLLQPNKVYTIKITVYNGLTEFFIDQEKIFSYQDPSPLRKGYFGFRTTEARQRIDHFRIYRLKKKRTVQAGAKN